MIGKILDRRELAFLALSAAAAVLFAVLALGGTAPLRPRVDLNTAGLDALCTLPGIGEKRARAILADRAANGPYARVEDVTRVSGITQHTIEDWGSIAYVSSSGPEGE